MEALMKRSLLTFVLSFLSLGFCHPAAYGQAADIKFVADTLLIQADGSYEADPDLATLTFEISIQDKDLKQTYDRAAQSMQKIIVLADKNGLAKEDIYSGVLTVRPWYEGDRKKKAKSYSVTGQITLKVKDFSKLGPILDGLVEDGIAEFRSLTYSLANEEAAKQKAVAEAMRRAMGRASAALEQKGQKIGALLFANLDVKQLIGVSQISEYSIGGLYGRSDTVDVTTGGGWGRARKAAPPPPPPIPQPEKITVTATVQCAFRIE
jgi:uncharacterized protein YggE